MKFLHKYTFPIATTTNFNIIIEMEVQTITLNHQKLAKALTYASKAVVQKPTIPILSNLLIRVKDSQLNIAATNLEMGISMWIPGSSEEDFSSTVNAKLISEFVNATSSQDENIILKNSESQVLVNTKQAKANFAVMPGEDFPVLPKSSEKPIFTITMLDLIKTINKVVYACAAEGNAAKVQYTGILFEFNIEDSKVSFIGLDGFRLSKKDVKVKNLEIPETLKSVIVPAKYLADLSRILLDYSDIQSVDIYMSENNAQIIFKFGDVEFSIRLIEGPFSDYKKILPSQYVYQFEIKKSELDNALKVINTFAKGNLGNKVYVDFDLESATLKFASSSESLGDGEVVINVSDPSGANDLKSAYTLKYLQDFVAHSESEKIIFETVSQATPTVLKDANDKDFLHLVMPIRRDR